MPYSIEYGVVGLVIMMLVAMSAYSASLHASLRRTRQGLEAETSSRLQAEGRLADSEQRLLQIIATEPECVKIQSFDGVILEMNPAGLSLVDADQPGDIVGTSVYRVIATEYREPYEEMTRRVFLGERVKLEFQIVSLKGRQRWLETHAAPLCDQDGVVTALLGITRDISDLKRYEDEIRLHYRELSIASRLNSMGQMATALAHELNQPLAAIANYSRGCLYRLESGSKGSDLKGAMEHVCKQAERAGDIIASVRRFLSKSNATFHRLDMRALVADALRIIAPEAQAHQTKICTRGVKSMPPVMGEAIQIEQVILNIVRNAIEAMESNEANQAKTVTISTEQTETGYVRLLFEDRGPVVPTIDPDQMFEAFFTTKPTGMGMGLPISKSIIEAHGGVLGVRTNAPEPGLTFLIELPLLEGGNSEG
ncbi:sensor histidine kinase [Hyphomicrobium sp.]|uniref:sensor histidine kinase n=1 Tax=Hyphomicrobium sp. TaxID=82 RepID=UPI002E2FA5EB|nr:ATP-binding protein [Hyphomicrobium sp.]HEX2841247.1 ATP-binding protein [Hyphomicrobium sp.]